MTFGQIRLFLIPFMSCYLMVSTGMTAKATQNPQASVTTTTLPADTRRDEQLVKLWKQFTEKKERYVQLMDKDISFRTSVEAAYQEKLREHAEFAATVNAYNESLTSAAKPAGPEGRQFEVFYDNPLVQEYVNRVGQTMVPIKSKQEYVFRVTLNPIPETRSLTTGTIYISTGLLALIDNEAQLAYLLAHEIAHIEKEHWKDDLLFEVGLRRDGEHKNFFKLFFTAIQPFLTGPMLRVPIDELVPSVGGGIASDRLLTGLSQYGNLGELNKRFGTTFGGKQSLPAMLKLVSARSVFSWDKLKEDEADDLATRWLLERNYDPQAALSFYAKLHTARASDPRLGLAFLTDGSRVSDRMQEIQSQVVLLRKNVTDPQRLMVGAFNLSETPKSLIPLSPEDILNKGPGSLSGRKPRPKDPYQEDDDERTRALRKKINENASVIQAEFGTGKPVAGREEFQLILNNIKRDAGVKAFQSDMFGVARAQLEEAFKLNPQDPQTNYHLALVTRFTARTPTERKLSFEMLTTAIQQDPVGVLVDARFQAALSLLDVASYKPDSTQKQTITRLLNEYVELFRQQHNGHLPPNMNRVQEYLRLVQPEATASNQPTIK
ncbi:MAG: M48 family metalloprotease [Acidobacteria bacterium]|nr:M48 family metalloprotease [Acidobacteriota bacterium]